MSRWVNDKVFITLMAIIALLLIFITTLLGVYVIPTLKRNGVRTSESLQRSTLVCTNYLSNLEADERLRTAQLKLLADTQLEQHPIYEATRQRGIANRQDIAKMRVVC